MRRSTASPGPTNKLPPHRDSPAKLSRMRRGSLSVYVLYRHAIRVCDDFLQDVCEYLCKSPPGWEFYPVNVSFPSAHCPPNVSCFYVSSPLIIMEACKTFSGCSCILTFKTFLGLPCVMIPRIWRLLLIRTARV